MTNKITDPLEDALAGRRRITTTGYLVADILAGVGSLPAEAPPPARTFESLIFDPTQRDLIKRMKHHGRCHVIDAGPRASALRHLELMGVVSIEKGLGKDACLILGTLNFDPSAPSGNLRPTPLDNPQTPA